MIIGNDLTALLRLWREKRSEAEPEHLSCNLFVLLGVAEALNRQSPPQHSRASCGSISGPKYLLAEPHSGSAAVLVNELDAGGFQPATHGRIV